MISVLQRQLFAFIAVGAGWLAMVPAFAAAQTLPAPAPSLSPSQDSDWTLSTGIGVWTLMRVEVAKEKAQGVSVAGALGLHPMGVPAVEVIIRRRLGPSGPEAGAYSVDLSALGFLPGTQFADDAEPGFGVHIMANHDWGWGSRRFVRAKAGVGLYRELPEDPATDAESWVVPVLGFEIGWKLRGS